MIKELPREKEVVHLSLPKTRRRRSASGAVNEVEMEKRPPLSPILRVKADLTSSQGGDICLLSLYTIDVAQIVTAAITEINDGELQIRPMNP